MNKKNLLAFPFVFRLMEGRSFPVLKQNLSFYIIAAIIFSVAIADVYLVRIADPDLWGNLLYGRYFLESGVSSVKDSFSYTATSRTWYTHEYLSQILLWVAYSKGGAIGLIILKCFVGGLTVLFIYLSVRLVSRNIVIWSPVFLLSVTQLSRFLIFRPQLFTYLGLSIFVFVLLKYLLYRRSSMWVLPIVMLFWVNLHGGFLAGIGALGLGLCLTLIQIYHRSGFSLPLILKEARPVIVALSASLGMTLLNPLGWRIWPFLFKELSNPYNRKYIIEWQPVSLESLKVNDAIMLFFILSMIMTARFASRINSNHKGIQHWQWLASCLPLILMYFISNRHAPLLLIWSTSIFVIFTKSVWESPSRREVGVRFLRLTFTSLVLFYSLSGLLITLTDPLPNIKITELSLGERQPFGSVEFMRINHLQGNVYAPLSWGSYISWKLYPDILVAMDGRNDTLYSIEMVGENLKFYFGIADKETPLKYSTDYLLVPSASSILNEILVDNRWEILYEDFDSTLFIRKKSKYSQQVENSYDTSFNKPVLRENSYFP